jgi:hypothetical protein
MKIADSVSLSLYMRDNDKVQQGKSTNNWQTFIKVKIGRKLITQFSRKKEICSRFSLGEIIKIFIFKS